VAYESENAAEAIGRTMGRVVRGGHVGRRIGLGVVAIVLAWAAMSSFARVQPGQVGIRVNNIAGGVSPNSLPVGWYFAPPGTHIYEYPVFTRTYTWTRSATEQNEVDESFNFQDKNGLSLKADVAVSYHVDPARASILFQRYRTDMDQIIAGPLRNAIRNAIVERAAQLGVEEIYGNHKAELIATAQARVQQFFAPVGLQVEQIYWAGNIVVPQAVLAQINARSPMSRPRWRPRRMSPLPRPMPRRVSPRHRAMPRRSRSRRRRSGPIRRSSSCARSRSGTARCRPMSAAARQCPSST